jgi:hypothetical protein
VVHLLQDKKTVAALSLALLAGCATNGLAVNPTITTANLSQNKVSLAVGTATLPSGSVGLNVVAMYRQPDGLSATLDNTPILTGPSGFVVPATVPEPTGTPGAANGWGGSGTNGGTATISGSAPQPNPNISPAPTTFGQVGGLFASGFGPYNDIGTGGTAYYPGNSVQLGSPYNITSPQVFSQPFYGTSWFTYVVGPPAVPFFNNGQFPAGFYGYLPGFTMFAATPVAGTYTLSVTVPAASQSAVTQTGTAKLSSTAPLGPFPAPTYTSDGKGGGTGTVTVPAGVVETEVFVADVANAKSPLFYTIEVTGTGTQTYTLPDNLGACANPGTSCTPSASMKSGDSYIVLAVGFDYHQLEAEPPGNKQQTPTLTGSNGQADLTASPPTTGTE